MVNSKLTIETIVCHQSNVKIILVGLRAQTSPRTRPLKGIIFDAKPEDGFLPPRSKNPTVFHIK